MTIPENISKLDRFLELTQEFATASDTEYFFQRLTVATSEITDSEVASILKFDESSNALRFISAPWFHQETLKDIIVPLDKSIAGWVFENKQPLIIQNVADDSRHYKAVDKATNFKTNSIIAVPLSYQGNAIGVLEVVNKLGNAHYTEDDVTILEILAVIISLTLRVSVLETSMKEVQSELTNLERLKSNFIAITSHELRTPLGLILGHATFLKETVSEEFHEPMDTIIRNATRLKEIIESLTNVDNYETGMSTIRKKKFSIPGLIKEIVASFQEMAANKEITLQTELPENGLEIEGDTNKVAVAISNLIRNSLTFSNEGSKVTVKAEGVTGHVKVSVKDDGIGIPADDLAYVFERFFQVESHLTRRHPGMGLGLSVAKTLIELHGGLIWAESVEGEGSTFYFQLPLKPKPIKYSE